MSRRSLMFGAALVLAVGQESVFAQITGGVQKASPDEGKSAGAVLSPAWVAQIKVLNGRASIEREGVRQEARVGTYLKQGDVLHTEATGSAGLLFNDNTTLSAGPNSHVAIHRFSFDTTTYKGAFEANVMRGTVAVRPGQIARNSPDAMRVNTPASEVRGHAVAYVIGVKGD